MLTRLLLLLSALWALDGMANNFGPVVVRTVKGSAYYQLTNITWQPLRPGAVLPGGASIRTGASSIASYDLLFTTNNHVIRIKSESTSSLVYLLPTAKSDAPAGVVSGSSQPGSDHTRLEISPDGQIHVNTGSLRVTYLDQEKEKPDHVTVNAGQSFKAPVPKPAQTPEVKFLQPVFEITITAPGKILPHTGINVLVPVISP